MTPISREQLPIIAAFIEALANRCEDFSAMIGVGGVETAGHLISYLSQHPKDLEPFLVGGFSELPDKWLEHGQLTYHANDGKVRHPQDARHSRIIKAMKWAGEVSPSVNDFGCVTVDMSLDELNAMRVLAGFKPLPARKDRTHG